MARRGGRRDGLWGLRRTTVGRTAAMETQAEAILTFGCNDVRRSGRTLRTVAHVPRFCGGCFGFIGICCLYGELGCL